MSIEVKLPELGESIETATVVKVLVEAGDEIEADAPVIEVETDKATAEVPSSESGTVDEIKVDEGDSIGVGDVILTLRQPSGDQSDGDAADEDDDEEPLDGDASDEEDDVEPSDDASRRADVDIEESDRDAGPGDTAKADGHVDAGARAAAEASGLPGPGGDDEPVVAAPSARRLADEIGVDIERVHGSGPGGRVSIRDVKRHAHDEQRRDTGVRPGPSATSREALTPVRKRVAEHMSWCWTTIPHVSLFAQADVTGLDAVLAEHREAVTDAGGKLTITAVVVKVVAAALSAFPRVNASYDEDNEALVIRPDINVGVAVDTRQGLVVPVIEHADRKSIASLAVEMTTLSRRARNDDLKHDDLKGGTFTVTNLGGMGVESFTPIVNHPEVAILGVGAASTRPEFIDEELHAIRRLPLALSFDHRAMDGADGARFLDWITRALAQPLLIAMET